MPLIVLLVLILLASPTFAVVKKCDIGSKKGAATFFSNMLKGKISDQYQKALDIRSAPTREARAAREALVYNRVAGDARYVRFKPDPKTVGKEADDLSRHDKWLCMMYPRLCVLRDFLRLDGAIAVSIGEDEVASLRWLLDEVFGQSNRLGALVWKRRSSSAMRGQPLSTDHEYVIVYGRDSARTVLHGLVKGPEGYPNEDAGGRFASTDLTVGMSSEERPGQYYVIQNPRTGKEYPPNPDRVWRFFPETMQEVIAKDLVIWPDDYPDRKMERPRYKTYYSPESARPKPLSSWIESTATNASELESISAEFDVEVITSGMTRKAR